MKVKQLFLVLGIFLLALLGHAAITSLAAVPTMGPGLGNVAYTEAELFKPVSWIRRDDQGVPATYPGRKAFGLNAGIMINGYFLTLFAPDSGAGPGGFLIYNISNPRAIQLVSRIYEPEGRTAEFREAHSFGVSKIAGRDYVAVATTKGIEFWDFTDVNSPQQVKKLALPTVNAGDYTNVSWQLFWQAPYVYVASANDGVYIVDARDPPNAVLANRGAGKPNPVPTGEIGGFRVGPIFTMGNTMVLTSMESTDGIASLDISDPLNPKVLDTAGAAPFYYATCYDGRSLYGSVRGAGAKMFSYNLADRSRFVAEDNRLVIDEQLYCATQDHYVFQGAQRKVHKVDVSNPLQHVEVGQGSMFTPGTTDYNNSDHGQVAAFGNLLFIGNDHGNGSSFMVHSTAPDTTPPAVRQMSPSDGARQQALTSRVGIGFTDSILPETVNASTFMVRPIGGNALPGTYSVQLGIVNFFPSQPLSPNTQYEVVLPAGGVKDYARNGVAKEFRAYFTTGGATDIDLAHYWTLSRTLGDQVGQNDGTPGGSDVYESIGLNFAQRTGGVPLKDDSVAAILGGSASLSFYMKTIQVGTNAPWTAPGIFGRDQVAGQSDVFWGWIDNTGRINLSVGDANTTNPVTKSLNPVNDGQWHHVVMTRDAASGAQAVYVDGVKTNTIGRTGTLGLNNRFQMLGQIQGNPDFFRGTLADVRVYHRVLGDSDVSQLRSLPIVGDPGLGTSAKLVNGQLAFDPTTLGPSAQYAWNFGDGGRTAFSTTARTTYTYSSPGHFNVTLTVRNSSGQESYYNTLVTVVNPVTSVAPTHTTNITGDANTVYSVNPDSGTVSAIDAQTMAKRWEVRVGNEPRTLAVGPDGRVWVTVQEEDKMVALNAADGSLAGSVQLDYGSAPYGVVFTPDRSKGLVTLENKATLLAFDPATGARLGTVALAGPVRGIAVSANSQMAYVTRFKSTTQGGQLHQVNVQTMAVSPAISLRVDTTTVDDESRARGVPNYLHQVVISPDGRRAALPSKKDNILRGRLRDGQDLLHDRTVRSILSQVDLVGATELFGEQLDFDDRAPARAALYSPDGDYLFVAQMEGNRVAIVDAYSRAIRGEITDVGLAPHGLYLDSGRKRLFVNNFLDRTVSVHDVAQVLTSESAAATRLQSVVAVAQETMSAAALRGKQLFYNAADRRMSRDNYMSCASCHADGGDDGTVWDFTQRGEGLRRTISLQGRAGLGHGNLHWSANFNEVQDFENDIRSAFEGTGFMSNADFAATADPLGANKAGKSAALDDLAAYLQSLGKFGRSPARNADGSLTTSAARGQQLFASAQCASCHSGVSLQDGLRHDVGTIQASSGNGNNQALAGLGFDTPTLFGTWAQSSFFHNGQAATVASTFTSSHGNAAALSATDASALAEYVRSIDSTNAAPLVRISSNQTGQCVNIQGNRITSDTAVIQWTCGNAANEKFNVLEVDGHKQYVARSSGLCIAQADTSATGGKVVQVACNSGARAQWLQNGATLRNRVSGACLDVPGGTMTPNTQLITWPCHGGNNQNWTLTGVAP